MNGSKLYLFLFFLIGNYFVTLLIIGLFAALISLLNKPKPLKINTVAEAFFSYYMLFTIGISNLINFVFHVFFGDTAATFITWENSPFQAEVICEPRHRHSRSHCLQGKFTVSIRYPDSACRFLFGSSRRSYLSDDHDAQFFAGERRFSSSKRYHYSSYRISVLVALVQASEIRSG